MSHRFGVGVDRRALAAIGSILLRRPFSLSLLALSLGVVAASLVLARYLPAYGDEVSTKIAFGRWFLDGRMSGLFPQCVQAYGVRPPFFMWPILVFQSALFGSAEGIFNLRLWGILHAVLGLAVSASCTAFLLRGRADPSLGLALPLSIFGLGALPFISVLTRGEQSIGAMILLALLLPSTADWRSVGIRGQAAAAAASCVGWAYALTLHPKTLFFAPLVLTTAWLTVRRPILRLPTLLALAGMALASLALWQARLSCPEADQVQQIFAAQAVFPDGFWRDLPGTAGRLISNLLSMPLYWDNLQFKATYTSSWLPDGMAAPWLNKGVAALFWVMLVAVVAGVVLSLRSLWRRCELSAGQTSLLVGVASLLALASFQTSKFFYESALAVPLLFACAVLGLLQLPRRIAAYGVAAFVAAATCVGLASQVLWWTQLTPRLSGAWMQPGYIADQPLSVSFSRPDVLRREVLAAAALCGIEPSARSRHVVVDDSTYPVMIQSSEPFHALYVAVYYGLDITDLRSFLTRHGSAGVVTACQWYPEQLAEGREQVGQFCCHPAFS